jgi:hypothetical protein
MKKGGNGEEREKNKDGRRKPTRGGLYLEFGSSACFCSHVLGAMYKVSIKESCLEPDGRCSTSTPFPLNNTFLFVQ